MTPIRQQAQEDSLEFLEELGYRFPDMTDNEVCFAYSEYVGIQMVPFPESLWGRRLIEVYEKGVKRWENESDEYT